MENLQIFSISGNIIEIPLTSHLSIYEIRQIISTKTGYPFQSIKIANNNKFLLDSQVLTSEIIDTGLIYHVISYQRMRTTKFIQSSFIHQTNLMIDRGIHPNKNSKDVLQAYHDAHRRITDPLYPLPHDYSQKLESLFALYHDKHQAELIFKMFNFNLELSIEYLFKPSSFFKSTVQFERNKSNKFIKNKNKKHQSSSDCTSVYSPQIFNLPPNSQNNFNKKPKKYKNRKNHYSSNETYSDPFFNQISCVPTSSSMTLADSSTKSTFSQLSDQLSKREEEIIRTIVNQTNMDFVEVMQFFLMSEKDPNATVQLILSLQDQ